MKLRQYYWQLCMVGMVVLAMFSVAPAARHAHAEGSFRAAEIVVKLEPLSGVTIDDINASYGTTTLKQLAGGSRVYLLRVPAGSDTLTLAQAMALDLRLGFAEPNFIGHTPEAIGRNIKAFAGYDPAPYGVQYAGNLLGLARAHAIDTGARAVVAVIDTGVQPHALLGNRLIGGYDFIDNDANPADEFNQLDDDGDGQIDEAAGHGTHVAGIVHLVAPDATIMPLRVLDSDGNGDVFQIIQALEFAVANGAHVINLSLGTSEQSKALKGAVRSATVRGAVVVAAAGNNGNNEPQYPAAANCALAVTATGPSDQRASFASYGSWVDVAAPGEAIFSSFPVNGYAWWSGTSMAAPFVSGQAALIRSAWPALSVRQVVTSIASGAHTLSDDTLGSGRIDIGATMELLAKNSALLDGKNPISGSCTELN